MQTQQMLEGLIEVLVQVSDELVDPELKRKLDWAMLQIATLSLQIEDAHEMCKPRKAQQSA